MMQRSGLKPVRVMHLITRLDMGGSAQNTLDTCIGLAEKYRITLIHGPSHESEMTPEEQKRVAEKIQNAISLGVEILPLRSLIRRIDPIQDFLSLIRLLQWMRRKRPHIVHTHTSKAGLIGRWAALLSGVPWILHTPHGHVFHGHFHPVVSRLFFLLEKITVPITDQILPLTFGEMDDYLRLGLCKRDRMTVIHSGVSIERYRNVPVDAAAKRHQLGLLPKDRLIGTAGWLLPIKGPDLLLRAMKPVLKRYPDAALLLMGKGPMEPELKRLSRQMGIVGRVHFLGWREDLHEILPLLEIFVLPSRNEGMGRVIVEAMAAGRPVVAASTGGIPDLVRDGENGLLFPRGDEKKLANALLRLLDDPKTASRMGALGEIRSRDYSLENMLNRIELCYKDLLHREKCDIAP